MMYENNEAQMPVFPIPDFDSSLIDKPMTDDKIKRIRKGISTIDYLAFELIKVGWKHGLELENTGRMKQDWENIMIADAYSLAKKVFEYKEKHV